MAVPIPVEFFVAEPPTDYPESVQELLNVIGASLGTQFTPGTDYILGQMGGVLPQSNVGPWANQNTWWFWNPNTGAYALGADGVPIGIMAYWGGQGAPPNWLVCDGTEQPIASYPALYQVIGDYWGSGDGTFFLPPGSVFFMNDDNFTPAAGVVETVAASNNWGTRTKGWGYQGGSQLAPLLVAANMPALDITIAFTPYVIEAPGAAGIGNLYPSYQTSIQFYGFQVLDSNGTPLNAQAQTQFATMPPFAAANVIIKYQ